MFRRVSTVAVAIAVFLFAFAPAAMAIPTETGTKNCSSQWVVVRSKGHYEVKHYWPTTTLRFTFNNSPLQVRETHTGLHETSWKVTANDTLDNVGTYAYCSSVG